jgi:hypothetical protein
MKIINLAEQQQCINSKGKEKKSRICQGIEPVGNELGTGQGFDLNLLRAIVV